MRTRSTLVPCVAVCALLVAPSLARAQGRPVPIRVGEADGVARNGWPLTVSVPLPRGSGVDAARVVVRDSGNKSLPTQARAFAHWPDGSIRWLLVDTQVSLRAGGEENLRVETGTAPAPPRALRVDESAEGIAIDSGAIQFAIPRQHLALFEALRIAGEKDAFAGPAALSLVTSDAASHPGAPRSLRLLESGPLRCRVEITGDYGNGFDYAIRIEAFAGQPFLRVQHTLIKTGGGAASEIRRLAVDVPLRAPGAGDYTFGVERGKPGRDHLGEAGSLRLAQTDNESFSVDGARRDGALAGWLEWEQPGGALGVAARWFWQEYPQAFQVTGERFSYEMYGGDAPPTQVGIGAAKTHDFTLWLSKRGQVGKRTAPALRRPLIGVVDPGFVAATGALPGALTPPAGGFLTALADAAERYLRRNAREEWNDCGEPRCDEAPERRRKGAYGMFNWGDWNFPGYEDNTKGTDAWGNLEYDTTQVLALAYAGSGRPQLLEATTVAARHFMDVDVIHALPPRPNWVGMNHPKNPMHFVFDLGGVDLGHTWTEGLISYYYLTGDERGLAAARGIADYLVARIGAGVRGNPRQWGWPQIALLAVFDATGETRYRDAALQYALQGSAAHAAKGLRSWKGGILADALAHTHAVTGDARIRQWLEEYVDYIRSNLMHQDARYYPAIAYMAMLKNDAKLREKAAVVAGRVKLGSWGKPFTAGGRIGLRIRWLLEGKGVTAAPQAPAQLTSAPPR